MVVQVRNGTPWDYEQVTVRPVELMRWNGQAIWDLMEPQRRDSQTSERARNSRASYLQGRGTILTDDMGRAASQTTEDGRSHQEAEEIDTFRPEPDTNDRPKAASRKGEQVFSVVVRKNSMQRFALEFAVEEGHLNPAPWCMPHTICLEHRYGLKVKLMKPSMWTASATSKAIVEPIVFDTPRLKLLGQ
jgi:hypothetical protein